MPIAIFRHRKLFVAIQKTVHSRVLKLNKRQIVDIIGKNEGTDKPTVDVVFTTLARHRGMRADINTVWRVSQTGVEVTQSKWYGFRSRRTKPVSYPPLTNIVWTDQDNSNAIFESIELGIASQPIVERYLHENTPNAYDYNILRIDFPEDGRVTTNVITPRPMLLVAQAEREDQSDSADEWLKLLLG
jgi:hypothetical protein